MGFEDTIRDLIAGVIVPAFESMNLDVLHYPYLGQDGKGRDDHATTGISRRALVDLTHKQYMTTGGIIVSQVAELTFLSPLEDTAGNAGSDRVNPIDPRDKFVLPNGITAPIISDGGFMDSGPIVPFVTSVKLGSPV